MKKVTLFSNPRRRNTGHKLPSDVVDYGSNTRHLTKSKWIEKYIASVKAHERIIDYQQGRRRTIPPSKDFALAQLWSRMYDQFPPWGDEADEILDARPRKNPQKNPRSNPMKKALQNRIALANKYINFAIKHGIMAEDYFGGTFPVIMTFEKPIEVSSTGRVVTVQWKDGYDMRPHKEKIYPNKFDGEEELRYTITAIIRGIKKGAKEDGWTLSHSGQSFSSKRSNPRKRKNAGHDLTPYEQAMGMTSPTKANRMFKQVEHLLRQPKNKIERKSFIDLGYGSYWDIDYKDGSTQMINVDKKTGKPVSKTQRRRKNSYHGRMGKPVNPQSKRWTFDTFSEKYFGKDYKSVSMRIRREFWSDFQYAFVGSLTKYIKETSEPYPNPRRRKNYHHKDWAFYFDRVTACRFTKRQQEILSNFLPQSYLRRIDLNASHFDDETLDNLLFTVLANLESMEKIQNDASYYGKQSPSMTEMFGSTLKEVESLYAKIGKCLGGQKNPRKRKNTRRRVRKYALRENDAPSAKQKKARAQAKKAMNLYQSGQANTLKQAWKMVRNPRRRR